MKTEPEDYTETQDYADFVEKLAQKCTCTPESDRPCAGLLAGGVCDDLQLERDPYEIEERQSHVQWDNEED